MNQTTFRRFHLGLALLLSATAMTAVGCTSPVDPASAQEVGTVRLPLVTPALGSYRLHAATFAISDRAGAPIVTLDSDSDPDAEALTATLNQGSYRVLLQDGWELDSVADDGTESLVQAALISQNPQAFDIRIDRDTALSFTFTTANGPVVLGDGSVDISVAVASNDGLAACNLMPNYGCPTGQTCLLADADGRTFCAAPGSLPVGSSCASEQCVAGAQCLKTDPSNPDQGACTALCDATASTFGVNCVSFFIENSNAGYVAPPPGTCDLLTQTGCEDGQACQYNGGNFATCGVPGETPTGSSCSAETCGAGATCYRNPYYGYGSVCTEICDAHQFYTGRSGCYYCRDAGTGYAGRCSNY